MTIATWQKTVDTWIKTYGVRYFDVKTNTLLLSEEVGELARLIARRYGEQSFKQNVSESEADRRIADEIGDIYFVLTCIANQLDIDLSTVLDKNIAKKTERDADRHQNLNKS